MIWIRVEQRQGRRAAQNAGQKCEQLSSSKRVGPRKYQNKNQIRAFQRLGAYPAYARPPECQDDSARSLEFKKWPNKLLEETGT